MKKTPSEDDLPEHTAGIAMSGMLCLNAFAAFLVLVKAGIFSEDAASPWPFIGLFVVANYGYTRLFIRNRNHTNVLEEMSKNKWVSKYGKTVFILYLLMSVSLLIILF